MLLVPLQILFVQVCETSPNPTTSPRACSSPLLEKNAPKLTPICGGDFTLA